MWERSISYSKVCKEPLKLYIVACTCMQNIICMSSMYCKKVSFSIYLDCGAGIGRVTKNLLLPLFDTVDMVEQNPEFLEKAKDYLVSLVSFRSVTHLSCHQSGVEIQI